MKATIVYQQIHDAINAVDENGDKKYKYLVLEGSSRSSKTMSLLQIYYNYANSHESARLSVWRDIAKDCRDTVLHDMNKAYPNFERYSQVNFHSTKSIFTFPTKSTIEICGTDDPGKVHGYSGEVIWLNEPYKISRDTFDQLDMRTTDMVFIDWNPKQSHWIEELKKDPRCLVLHSTFKDNPFCPDEPRRKILGYQSIKKSWAVYSGLMKEHDARNYDVIKNVLLLTVGQIKELIRCRENELKNSANDFNWDVYGLGIKAEKPHRIIRCTEIQYADYLAINATTYTGVDWGKVDPWGIVDVKYYDGCVYVHEVNYSSEDDIRSRLTTTELAQIQEQNEGFVKWYFNRFNIPKERVIVCDTNRPLKTGSLRTGGWKRAVPASNKSILDGVDVLTDLQIFYTHTSTNFKYEQENWSREIVNGVAQEEPEDKDNHLIDPLKYVLLHLKRLGIIKTI